MSGPGDVLLDSKSINASPNAFVLSTWMLKSPTISALSTLTNRSERKSAKYCTSIMYIYLFKLFKVTIELSVLSSVSICSDFSSLLRRSEEVRPAPSHHPLPLLWLKDFCSSCFIVFFSCPAEKLWLFLLWGWISVFMKCHGFCKHFLFLLLVFAGSTNADGLNSNSAFPSTNASSLLFLASVWLMARRHRGMLLLTSSHERALPVFAFFFFFNFKYFLRKWIHLEEIFRC